MDELTRSARDQINAEVDQGLKLIIEWKVVQLKIRGIIENIGTDDALSEAHREESEIRNELRRWADEL